MTHLNKNKIRALLWVDKSASFFWKKDFIFNMDFNDLCLISLKTLFPKFKPKTTLSVAYVRKKINNCKKQ